MGRNENGGHKKQATLALIFTPPFLHIHTLTHMSEDDDEDDGTCLFLLKNQGQKFSAGKKASKNFFIHVHTKIPDTVKSRFNIKSRIKVQNLVTKMEFHIKKS